MNIIFPQTYFHHTTISNVDDLRNLKIDESYNVNWAIACSVKVEGLFVDDLIPYIYPVVNNFLKRANISLENFELMQPWKNTYEKGGFQEIHDHGDSILSGCIFLDNPDPDFGNFYFYNRHAVELLKPQRQLLSNLFDSPYLSFVPSVVKGDILIFPSYLMHGVTMHKSEKTRTTISFNIDTL